MTTDAHIRLLLNGNVSELDYNFQKLEIFNHLATMYESHLPKKWQPLSREILERSGCFRDWVIRIIELNNAQLIRLFLEPNFPKQNLYMWREWQLAFIKEDNYFPPKVILQAAVNEWHFREKNKHRVSEVVTPI